MTGGEFSKTGWRRTRSGWKRIPKLQAKVKKVAVKRRPTKRLRIQPAEAEKLPTFAEARKLAAEQGRADSAPIPAPPTVKPARATPRKAWSGKYDDLSKPEGEAR
jgi:hypothetical protein